MISKNSFVTRFATLMWLLSFSIAAGCKQSPDSLWLQADVAFHRQDYAHADRLYRRVLAEFKPHQPITQTFIARKAQLLLRLARVNSLYLHHHDDALHYFEGLSHFAMRVPEQADLERTALLGSIDLRLHRLHDLKGAKVTSQQLFGRFPYSEEARRAHLWLMSVHLREQEFDKTRALASRVVRFWGDSPSAFAAHFTTANTYLAERRFDKAIDLYEKLAKTDASSQVQALVSFELGQCYQEIGDNTKALQFFYTARGQHPNPAAVQHKIDRVRARLASLAPVGSILNASLVHKKRASFDFKL